MATHRRTLILSLAAMAAAIPARAQDQRPQPPRAQPPAQQGQSPQGQSPQGQRPRLTLDQMFEALKLAPDDASARAVEVQIWHVWMQAGSPAVQLLMRRGLRHLETRSLADAVEDFDAIIALAPELPEGWNKRATAYFLLGDHDNAVKDIQETLAREPRHFGALAGLSHILEARGDHAAALRAYERALALHPRMAGHENRLKELRRRALGEES